MCAGSLVTVTLDDALLRISGDLAYQIGIERCDGIIAGQAVCSQHRVTNIYRREPGGWKMIHRHADLNPAERDLPQLFD
jgi:ketosteroid isomerase-like protein